MFNTTIVSFWGKKCAHEKKTPIKQRRKETTTIQIPKTQTQLCRCIIFKVNSHCVYYLAWCLTFLVFFFVIYSFYVVFSFFTDLYISLSIALLMHALSTFTDWHITYNYNGTEIEKKINWKWRDRVLHEHCVF